MATKIWRGSAQKQTNVWHLTPANPEPGDVFIISINRIEISYTAEDSDGVAEVVSGLVSAWNTSTEPEVAEITASSGTDANGVVTHVVLTHDTAGVPFIVAGSTSDAGGFEPTVTVLQQGDAGQNETQVISLSVAATGGTFTLTFEGQTTGNLDYDATAFEVRDALCALSNIGGVNEIQDVEVSGASSGDFTLTFNGQETGAIAFNASAANVQSALEALSNIAAGDVSCTGGDLNTNPVAVEFTGNLGKQALATMTVNDSTDGAATCTEDTAGVDADVSVSGNAGGPWTVEFVENLANTNVAFMSGTGTSLTGGHSVDVETVTDGSAGTNEIQDIAYTNRPAGSTYILRIVDPATSVQYSTGQITVGSITSSSASNVKTYLEALSFIDPGDVQVTVASETDNENFTLQVEFTGSLAGTDIELMTSNNGNIIPSDVQDGTSTPISEVQVIRLPGQPTSGNFTLTFEGQTTGNLTYDESAADMETALEALSNITGLSVSGDDGGPWTVTFDGAPSGDVGEMTGASVDLAGGVILPVLSQAATDAANETQLITMASGVSGGTFTITLDFGGGDEVTGAIAYDASAATVQTALIALSTPDSSDFIVSGPDGGPWTIEFADDLAAADWDTFTIDGGSLTGSGTQDLSESEITAATGPNWVDDADNWYNPAAPLTPSLPTNSDDVYFQDNDVDALYGLDQLSAVTLTSLNIDQSYTGRIGLPQHTGQYYEYRPQFFDIGATNLYIGQGDGSGSGRIKLNTGSVQTEIIVVDTGTPVDDLQLAVIWKGTHAGNVVRVFKGSFGAAVFPGETANVSGGLEIGYQDSVNNDSTVFLGSGVTIATVDKSGGNLTVNSAIATSIVQTGGVATINGSGAVAALELRGEGRLVYNTTGTLGGNPVVADEAILDFSQDMRARTVTNPVEVYGDAEVIDPAKKVSSLVVDLNYTGGDLSKLQLGTNIRLTRGATS